MDLNRARYTDIDFNQKFEQTKELTKEIIKEKDRQRLENLNKETTERSITELSVMEILIGIKDTWFELIDDLLQKKFNAVTFTMNNRMFFIGITIIIIAVLAYIYSLFTSDEPNNNENKIVKIYHVYQNGKIAESNGD